MNKPTKKKMKTMTALLLSRAQDSLDESSFCDRAQDVANDKRECATKILEGEGFRRDQMDDDEAWDELVEALSESVEWVPESYQLTVSNA